MKTINFILVLLLLISSCEYEHRNATPKRRVKRNSEEQSEVQKTPEAVLKEKLNDTEKSNLDFLKDALGDTEKFNQLLNLDEEKIKAALEHIKTQLESCKENAENSKATFKEVVKGYFSKMDDNTLNGFKDGATSGCVEGGTGG
ncbi:Mlp lipoprotein family protein (plasmid) [Borrelia nietonii YOR]|uniref:Mlp lipoprotein family protein n=1 Tax=Borrelia nietonii YOR TaxID=1293576 RepID=W5SBJ3_9SPIR|nr:Mlp family lipoprotein [Borrelia nietonii]AHH04459.1 Mlp lipoprotein family protein [Borrelia nietonii YOR]